jgi:hypothetical protein
VTIRELLTKYPTNVENTMVSNKFKSQYLFTSGGYETFNPCDTIYSYCYDGRRGVWVNVFTSHQGNIACIQISAGREGDDACATILLDKQWLSDLAMYNELGNRSTDEFSGTILECGSLDCDITDYALNEIGCYGTGPKETVNHILTVLQQD